MAITQKTKAKKKPKVTRAPQKPKTTEEIRPVSKYKEWKLLYTPYPFSNADNSTSPREDSPTRASPHEEDLGKYKGLCKNCKKQKTCKLPKPEGGVWRCEDYE